MANLVVRFVPPRHAAANATPLVAIVQLSVLRSLMNVVVYLITACTFSAHVTPVGIRVVYVRMFGCMATPLVQRVCGDSSILRASLSPECHTSTSRASD